MLAIRWCAPIHVFRTTTLRPAEPTPRRAKAPTQTQSRLAPQPRYSWPGLNFNTPITPMSHTVSGWVVGVGGGSGCSIGLGLFLGGWVLGVGGGGWGRRLYYWLRLNLARHACRPMYDVRPTPGKPHSMSYGHPCWFNMWVVYCSGHILSAVGGDAPRSHSIASTFYRQLIRACTPVVFFWGGVCSIVAHHCAPSRHVFMYSCRPRADHRPYGPASFGPAATLQTACRRPASTTTTTTTRCTRCCPSPTPCHQQGRALTPDRPRSMTSTWRSRKRWQPYRHSRPGERSPPRGRPAGTMVRGC